MTPKNSCDSKTKDADCCENLSIKQSQNASLSYKNTGYFSSLICDYLDKKDSLKPFYQNFSNLNGYKQQIALKQNCISASSQTRQVLVSALKLQYKKVQASEPSLKNIQSLLSENTFTVTTGHQLNLFTGPLYFLYKIVTVINLAKELKCAFPDKNFVPIYWMATEDHDFEEINYFNFKGQKVKWNGSAGGAVGQLSTKGLNEVFNEFSKNIGSNKSAEYLKELFEKAYLKHENLADATFYLANELFSSYGLVIIDADNSGLKRLFVPIIKDELVNQTCFKAVNKSAKELAELHYKIQVNARDINLFYLLKNKRERIVFEQNTYKILNTDLVFTEAQILEAVDLHPERFSPNVLMRPLYQERILPNLSYTGGGGELAYWFEMKAYFDSVGVPFPILLLRNSVLVMNQKQLLKLNKLNLKVEQLFLKQTDLNNLAVKALSDINLDLSVQKVTIQNLFTELKTLALQTDKSFIGAVNAQEHKQINGFEKLEARLLKAQKRKYNELTKRIFNLQNDLFPNQSLQERTQNFSELYLELGTELIPLLIKHLNPLALEFTILVV